jgi:hypothetical protein
VSDVRDTCNGIYDVLSGPTSKNGKCCYTVCRGLVAPCGRLFLDAAGTPRLARVAPRNDWRARATAAPEGVRAAWRTDALLEHASVAAFARFSLELLAVGAPAELVAAAHRAALDEIEHARLAFALAAGDDGPVGPTALDLAGLAPRTSLVDVARAVAEECCAGETFAAMIAQRALELATEEPARTALSRIAPDEALHAELGWRAAGWAIALGGAPVRAAVAEGLARGAARVAAAAAPVLADPALGARWGRLPPAELALVQKDALALLAQIALEFELVSGGSTGPVA